MQSHNRIEKLNEEEVVRRKSRVVDPVGVDPQPDPTLEKNLDPDSRTYFDQIYFFRYKSHCSNYYQNYSGEAAKKVLFLVVDQGPNGPPPRA